MDRLAVDLGFALYVFSGPLSPFRLRQLSEGKWRRKNEENGFCILKIKELAFGRG